MKNVEKDDEFFGIEFAQSSDNGVREVLPVTYALMCWWKVRMGNQDTIDISEDSNFSMLRYESTFAGEDYKGSPLGEEDNINLDHIIEVNESEMLASYYAYIPKRISEELVSELALSLMDINPSIRYGSIELYTTQNAEEVSEHFLRYRVSSCLKGIKVGKTDVIENMVNYAQFHYGEALFSLCQSETFKKWVLK
jgi:hypothetical protein